MSDDHLRNEYLQVAFGDMGRSGLGFYYDVRTNQAYKLDHQGQLVAINTTFTTPRDEGPSEAEIEEAVASIKRTLSEGQ